MASKCAKCQGPITCTRKEVGSSENYDGVYIHSCQKCGHVEESEVRHEGVVSSYDDPKICPMCGKKH